MKKLLSWMLISMAALIAVSCDNDDDSNQIVIDSGEYIGTVSTYDDMQTLIYADASTENKERVSFVISKNSNPDEIDVKFYNSKFLTENGAFLQFLELNKVNRERYASLAQRFNSYTIYGLTKAGESYTRPKYSIAFDGVESYDITNIKTYVSDGTLLKVEFDMALNGLDADGNATTLNYKIVYQGK